MAVSIEARVEKVEPGAIKGQIIVEAKGDGVRVRFDVIKDLVDLKEGDRIKLVIKDAEEEDAVFCGRGYVVPQEGDRTIFSVWGILFVFTPSIDLEPDKEYFLCIKK
ncbi:MAG: DNA-directed RNA polymerase subunit G [Desulfurococcales archaeon]|nr:DNA-directed RNA polymerase subunit G [Desulfurococcales archaeon]